MATEIERKFLVIGNEYKKLGEPVYYQQGYLCADAERTVRVRIAGKKAFLTIKGKSDGISRSEFEYDINIEDAKEMLETMALAGIIEKYRYTIQSNEKTWEIDEFLGDNEGLIIAEVELECANEEFEKPSWLGDEVSDDKRYFNALLSKNPYKQWK